MSQQSVAQFQQIHNFVGSQLVSFAQAAHMPGISADDFICGAMSSAGIPLTAEVHRYVMAVADLIRGAPAAPPVAGPMTETAG